MAGPKSKEEATIGHESSRVPSFRAQQVASGMRKIQLWETG